MVPCHMGDRDRNQGSFCMSWSSCLPNPRAKASPMPAHVRARRVSGAGIVIVILDSPF